MKRKSDKKVGRYLGGMSVLAYDNTSNRKKESIVSSLLSSLLPCRFATSMVVVNRSAPNMTHLPSLGLAIPSFPSFSLQPEDKPLVKCCYQVAKFWVPNYLSLLRAAGSPFLPRAHDRRCVLGRHTANRKFIWDRPWCF